MFFSPCMPDIPLIFITLMFGMELKNVFKTYHKKWKHHVVSHRAVLDFFIWRYASRLFRIIVRRIRVYVLWHIFIKHHSTSQRTIFLTYCDITRWSFHYCIRIWRISIVFYHPDKWFVTYVTQSRVSFSNHSMAFRWIIFLNLKRAFPEIESIKSHKR